MILFICGIPASGKSTFGKYLRDVYSFYYIPMEEDVWPDEELHKVWNRIFVSKGEDIEECVRNFVNSVKSKRGDVALDLGFPVNELYFQIVKSLKYFGCRIIWFRCDEDIARNRWLTRDSRPIAWFDDQINRIRKYWDSIEEIKPEVINVLKFDKSDKTNEELFLEIFEKDLPEIPYRGERLDDVVEKGA